MISEQLRDPILIAHLRGHPLHELASHYKLPLPDLVAWFKSPPIVALLDALEAIADRQAALSTAHARVTAINTLESAARGAEISDSEFRAASALIRNTPKSVPARRPVPTSRDTESPDRVQRDSDTLKEAPHAPHRRGENSPPDQTAGAEGQAATPAPSGAHARDHPNT